MAHQDVIAIALAQVGKRENPKGSNAGPDVEPFTGGRPEPWCGHFVAWCFRTAGKPLPDDKEPSPKQFNPLASVSHTERIFMEAGWSYREPQPGDLVFYTTRGRSDQGPGRHVGLVVATGVDSFETVEANWGDSVCHRVVKRSDKTISGFGRFPEL